MATDSDPAVSVCFMVSIDDQSLGAYRVAIVGGLVIGAPIGGLLARAFGITAPFWFGFFGSAILVALLWRQFLHIAHAAETT